MAIHARPPAAGLKRRRVIAGLGGVGLLGPASIASAQPAWSPSRPIKFIVPYPPGGSVDILIRLITPALAEKLGQPMVVENRAGATGTLGTNLVYSSAADGSTLLVGVSDQLSIYPHLAKTQYDATRFVPIAHIGSTGFVLVGRPGLPADNLQDLIALARRKQLSFANAGQGGSIHLTTLAFGLAAKIDDMLHVPYTGGAPARQAVLGDQVDLFMSLVGGASAFRSKMKFYGVSTAGRVQAMADVPTFTEQGLPLVRELWMGIVAPPNTPSAVAEALGKAISDVVGSPTYRTKVGELAMEPGSKSQHEFASYYLDEYRRWGEVARSANVKLE